MYTISVFYISKRRKIISLYDVNQKGKDDALIKDFNLL